MRDNLPPLPDWREHVEQRLRQWRQSFVNKSGDRLALDDFMDAASMEDLVDFVCDEWVEPPVSQTQRTVRLTDERMIEIFRASDFVLPTDEWALEVARAVEAEVLRLNGIGGDDE